MNDYASDAIPQETSKQQQQRTDRQQETTRVAPLMRNIKVLHLRSEESPLKNSATATASASALNAKSTRDWFDCKNTQAESAQRFEVSGPSQMMSMRGFSNNSKKISSTVPLQSRTTFFSGGGGYQGLKPQSTTTDELEQLTGELIKIVKSEGTGSVLSTEVARNGLSLITSIEKCLCEIRRKLSASLATESVQTSLFRPTNKLTHYHQTAVQSKYKAFSKDVLVGGLSNERGAFTQYQQWRSADQERTFYQENQQNRIIRGQDQHLMLHSPSQYRTPLTTIINKELSNSAKEEQKLGYKMTAKNVSCFDGKIEGSDIFKYAKCADSKGREMQESFNQISPHQEAVATPQITLEGETLGSYFKSQSETQKEWSKAEYEVVGGDASFTQEVLWSLKRFEVGSKLGSGKFSEVFLARQKLIPKQKVCIFFGHEKYIQAAINLE